MRDDEAVAGAIDRIVAGSGLPGRAARDDLRRELETHFEEACADPGSIPAALRRFGSETEVAGALRRIYRRDAVLRSAARIAASLASSAAAAVLIEGAANLRLAPAGAIWRLAPGFSYSVPVAVAVALTLVAVREAIRRTRPLPSTLAHRSAAPLLAFAAFAAGEYALHFVRGVEFGPARALAAGAVLVLVWASTLVITGRVDRAFVRLLDAD